MFYPYKKLLMLIVLVGSGNCIGIQVALGEAPTPAAMDCEVYNTERHGITEGFRVGNLLLSAGQEDTVSSEREIAWNKVVQGLIARYVEVCSRYNEGAMTKEEYDNRIDEIEMLYREAQKYENQMIDSTRSHANKAFDELDRMIPSPSANQRLLQQHKEKSDPIAQGLQVLGVRIDQLEAIGRPLMPTTPCNPPDILGSLGARC